MNITIEHFGDNFNVSISSKAGSEPFLKIRGCRIVSGGNGEFVSWPARKGQDGKWWNHVYASDAFNAAVLAEAKEAKAPAKPARQSRPSRDDDESIPF